MRSRLDGNSALCVELSPVGPWLGWESAPLQSGGYAFDALYAPPMLSPPTSGICLTGQLGSSSRCYVGCAWLADFGCHLVCQCGGTGGATMPGIPLLTA